MVVWWKKIEVVLLQSVDSFNSMKVDSCKWYKVVLEVEHNFSNNNFITATTLHHFHQPYITASINLTPPSPTPHRPHQPHTTITNPTPPPPTKTMLQNHQSTPQGHQPPRYHFTDRTNFRSTRGCTSGTTTRPRKGP